MTMNPRSEVLDGVPPALLAAKTDLETALRGEWAPRAQRVSANAVEATARNIQGVAIGFGGAPRSFSSGGSPAAPGDPVLTVYVSEPAHPSEVRAAMVKSMGVAAAAEEGDVPLQSVVTGYIDAQPHRLRLRPAPAGDSIGHYRITAGTLGCLAVGRSAPRASRLLILSNNHVLANENDAAVGDGICQPGPYDGGALPADQVAVLERFVPLQFDGPTNYVDCATAWAWPERVRGDLLQLSGGKPAYFHASTGTANPQLGMAVGKSGRTSQVTSGQVSAVGASIWVNYSGGRTAYFEDQIAIHGVERDFSAPGDSGSLVWTWDTARIPVALLFAGGGGSTFANRMPRVLDALDIELYT